MLRRLLIAGLLPLSLSVSGQGRYTAPKPGPILEKTWWVQYNPLTLLEPELPLTATLTYKVGNQISVGLDAGVFVAWNDYDNTLRPYSGYRFKPEVKFYPAGERTGPRWFYIALQGLIKHTSRQREEWLTRLDSGAVVFSQLVDYKEKKMVLGMNVLFGSEFVMGPNRRFMIDVYGGCGARNKKFHADGLPDGISIDYDDRFNDRVFNIFNNGVYGSLSLGFKLGYRLNWNQKGH